jgi:predicted nucleic acid-binding protein
LRLYLDTSALAKRYLQEIGSDDIKQIIFEAESVAISIVGKVEMFSALSRTSQYGLGEETIKLASQAFKDDFAGFLFLKLHDEVVNLACETAYKYKLRGFDAIHLATAQIWMNEVDEMVHFCTYDHQLWHAAKKTKLRVLPEKI